MVVRQAEEKEESRGGIWIIRIEKEGVEREVRWQCESWECVQGDAW